MELGNLILKYRKKYNLSQEDLAKEIGVTRQTISKWELNETTPDLKQAVKLAETFNIDFNKIINIIKDEETEKGILKDKIKNYTLILSLSLLIIIIVSLISIFFYNYGYNKNHSTLYIVCNLNEKQYQYAISFDDTNDVIQYEGDPYINNIAYEKGKRKKAIDVLTDINNHFKTEGGYCE